MMKYIFLTLFTVSFIFNAFGQIFKSNNKKIKLNNEMTQALIYFKNENYLLAFSEEDINQISKKLNIKFDLKVNDTIDFKRLPKLFESKWTGRNSYFTLDSELMNLIDKGSVVIYNTSNNKIINKLNKSIESHSAAGTIYYYRDKKKLIIQFIDVFIGCPSF